MKKEEMMDIILRQEAIIQEEQKTNKMLAKKLEYYKERLYEAVGICPGLYI